MNEEKLVEQLIEKMNLGEKIMSAVDEVMEKNLKEIVGPMVTEQTKTIVQKLQAQRALFGKDMTGLSNDQKKEFAESVRDFVVNGKAQTSEEDSAGGFLVPVEVANAILRIARSVGLISSQAQVWPMGSDQLDVPNFTGAALEGEYLGVDAVGTVTTLAFGQASLIAKKWQLAFALGNDLLSDAKPAVADWLISLAAESMANMVDKQGFDGVGLPFVGIRNHADPTVVTLSSGNVDFVDYDVVVDSSDVIGNLEESILEGSAFYMHRTVWAKLRSQKDTAGNFILQLGGRVLTDFPKQGGRTPAGEILGYPVFTTSHLPKNADSAISTKFIIFGNLKGLAFGTKGDLRLARHDSGAFGGNEIALSDQTGMVFKQRHALVVTLGASFVVVKTAAA